MKVHELIKELQLLDQDMTNRTAMLDISSELNRQFTDCKFSEDGTLITVFNERGTKLADFELSKAWDLNTACFKKMYFFINNVNKDTMSDLARHLLGNPSSKPEGQPL